MPSKKEATNAVMDKRTDFYEQESAELKAMKVRWGTEGATQLTGRKIIGVRYMNQKEVEALGWRNAAVVLVLDDGTMLFPSMDDEGNNAGALFGQKKNGQSIDLPVI